MDGAHPDDLSVDAHPWMYGADTDDSHGYMDNLQLSADSQFLALVP